MANNNYDNYDDYNTGQLQHAKHNRQNSNRVNMVINHDCDAFESKNDENNNDYLMEKGGLYVDYSDNTDESKICGTEPVPDMYQSYKFGDCIPRSGKVFSYTFWRIKANADVFWSIQGNNEMEGAVGGVWIATQYFGNPSAAPKFRQEITLTHPTEHNIQMTYASPLTEGENCIFISKAIVHHFRNEDNSIDFDFRIVRSKKNHRNRKKTF